MIEVDIPESSTSGDLIATIKPTSDSPQIKTLCTFSVGSVDFEGEKD